MVVCFYLLSLCIQFPFFVLFLECNIRLDELKIHFTPHNWHTYNWDKQQRIHNSVIVTNILFLLCLLLIASIFDNPHTKPYISCCGNGASLLYVIYEEKVLSGFEKLTTVLFQVSENLTKLWWRYSEGFLLLLPIAFLDSNVGYSDKASG